MAGFAKWIGGGLGWAIGGPIGAILGYAFGSMFDKTSELAEYDVNEPYRRRQSNSDDFAASLLILSAAVMKADGKVVKAELDYVKGFLQQQFGEAKASDYVLDLREILKQDINIVQFLNYIYLKTHKRKFLLKFLKHFQFRKKLLFFYRQLN